MRTLIITTITGQVVEGASGGFPIPTERGAGGVDGEFRAVDAEVLGVAAINMRKASGRNPAFDVGAAYTIHRWQNWNIVG